MQTTGNGVPRIAVLASTAVGFLTVIADDLVPEAVWTTR
jgi:GABA permease